jgi:uncharacterized protein YbjQ (UPF0145 family)
MRLFSTGSDEDDATRRRREASVQSLEQGGLPLNAVDRLREQAARQGKPGHIFTSDLSVNELVMAHEVGAEPLGQVMGSSVYHVGFQFLPFWNGDSGELTVLTHAYNEATRLAIGRLQQEAALLGATAVIGVRLLRGEYDWGIGLLEFQAIGTAIREKDVTVQVPAVTDLSGQEYWALHRTGFRPVGFVLGNCSYYLVPTWRTQNAMAGSWINQELVDYTQGVYNARSLAMGRMEAGARSLNAHGVVGADISLKMEPREIENNGARRVDILYHFTAIGTAVEPYTGKWPVFSIQKSVPLR